MKIAIIGAGAMGSLFGGYLSIRNETFLIDTNVDLVNKINKDGLTIIENDKEIITRPKAVLSAVDLPKVDLVILFVKALYSKSALESNKNLFGENTYVLTLQNGSGHELLLKEYVNENRILIGTTQDNCAVKGIGVVKHGGKGLTHIGSVAKEQNEVINNIIDAFCNAGFSTEFVDNIQYLIWDKLFLNTSVSVLTGVLQVKMGFMADNDYGKMLMEKLIEEAVSVANQDGFSFDAKEIIKKTYELLEGSKEGITSICSDIGNGRLTEVDTISGSVVRTSKANGVPAPTHECMVNLVHAMEQREIIKFN